MLRSRQRSRPIAGSLFTWLLMLALWVLPASLAHAQTWSTTYTGNFSTPAGPVSAGGSIAGLIDEFGNVGTVASSKLNLASGTGSAYYQDYLVDPNSNNNLDQWVTATMVSPGATTFSMQLFTRAFTSGGRWCGYCLNCAYNPGTGNCYFVVQRTDPDASQNPLAIPAGSTYPGYITPTLTDNLKVDFKAVGTQPTTLTATLTDTTTSTVVATITTTDSTTAEQSIGYAGIATGVFSAAGGGTPWSVSALTVQTAPAAAPLASVRPVLVSRASGQNVLSVTASGGVPPYTVQIHRELDDWDYTPASGDAIGSALTIATSGGTATYTDTASISAGRYYIYKAIVTDSASTSVQAGDYLFVEGLRATPGSLPSVSTSAAGGILLATWGDSITAPGSISNDLMSYFSSNGVTVSRTANAGFQGSTWTEWETGNTDAVEEGAVDTNAGQGGATYASEFNANGGTVGSQIPGTGCLAKAFYITDHEVANAPGKLLVISVLLGMNDMLQGATSSTSITAATSVVSAIRTKYPNALIVLHHMTYGFPGADGPTSLVYITNCQAAWNGIKALADNVHVFVGDDSSFYYLYGNALLTNLYQNSTVAGWLDNTTAFVSANGGSQAEHVHPIAAGDSVMISNTSAEFGEGPALMRTAISYSSGSPTVSSVSVSPSTVTLAGGATQTFSATVTGTNSPAQTVTWSATAGSFSGAVYTAPAATGSTQTITITATSTVDNTKSGTATVTVNALTPAATPTFSPAAGTYSSIQSVTISTSTGGATIRYTVDGSTPTESNGTVYSSAISVSTSETVKAIAYASGYTDSSVASAAYTISLTQVSTPTFSPAAGAYGPAQTVTISTSTGGATLYYTVDGTTPTTSSTVYSAPITVSSSETVKALAVAAGMTNSAIGSAAYVINGAAATPTFSPAAGTYSSTQTVAISTSTGGATIYYTIDGSTPSTSSSVYSTALSVSASETVKAIVVASGYSNSAVGSAAYVISSGGGGGSGMQTTDPIDSAYPSGVSALQEIEERYVLDLCNYSAGAINPSTHAQTVTYYAKNGTTVLATGTISYDVTNTVKSVRPRLTFIWGNFASASGSLLASTVIDNTGSSPVMVGTVQRDEDALRIGASNRTVVALVDTATFFGQGGSGAGAVVTSVITTNNDGSSTRVVTAN